ncbi:MAG: hypothetical protein ACQETP_03545, partial [Bacteroidota bacterium]
SAGAANGALTVYGVLYATGYGYVGSNGHGGGMEGWRDGKMEGVGLLVYPAVRGVRRQWH